MKNLIFRWLDSLFPHTHDPDKPCPPLKEMLSQMSDGTLTGFKRWFVLNHIAGCTGCFRTLENLRSLRNRLSRLDKTEMPADNAPVIPLDPERRAAIEAAWEELDKTAR